MGRKNKRTGRDNKSKGNRKIVIIGLISAGLIITILFVIFGLNLFGKTDERAQLKRIQNGEEPLNLIIISIDTLRSDYLSCYGSKEVETPNIDRFASEGTMFSDCRCQVPQTLPSHLTLMTGTYPNYHGVSHNTFRVPEGLTTLAEILEGEGYKTGAVIGAFPLDSNTGFSQGFDSYDCEYTKGVSEDILTERTAEEVWESSRDWLDDNRGDDFFLFIHMYDPHYPYEPPDTYKGKFAENPYAGEVKYVDDVLGQISDYLRKNKLDDNTLVIILSDHGEALMEHGELEHGYFIYEEVMRVPLIFRCPGLIPGGKVVEGPIGLMDVMPTLLELLGISIGTEIQGKSLIDYIYSDKEPDFLLYAETKYPTYLYGWQSLYSYTVDGWKFIEAPEPELYDLAEDPDEMKNLVDEFPEKSLELSLELDNFSLSIASLSDIEAGGADLTDSDIDKLKTLGYVSVSGIALTPLYPDIDPKDKIEFHEVARKYIDNLVNGNREEADEVFLVMKELEPDHYTVNSINAKINKANKNYIEAERYIQLVLEENPENTGIKMTLASIYYDTSRVEAAAEVYEELIKDDRISSLDRSQAFLELGKIELNNNKNYDAASEYFLIAKSEIPEMAEPYYFLAITYSQMPGYEDKAVKYGKTFLARDPDNRNADQITTLIRRLSSR